MTAESFLFDPTDVEGVVRTIFIFNASNLKGTKSKYETSDKIQRDSLVFTRAIVGRKDIKNRKVYLHRLLIQKLVICVQIPDYSAQIYVSLRQQRTFIE